MDFQSPNIISDITPNSTTDIIELSGVPFVELLNQQEIAFEKIKKNQSREKNSNSLNLENLFQSIAILAEVEPTITLGKRFHNDAAAAGVLVSHGELLKRGIQLHPVARGGKSTYHGPGQLILFYVVEIDRLTGSTRGVRKAVEFYLRLAKKVAEDFAQNSDFEIRDGVELGLWSSQGGKVASVGIEVREGILLHGLSINVFPTSTSFYGLNPCGLEARVDYLLPLAQMSLRQANQPVEKSSAESYFSGEVNRDMPSEINREVNWEINRGVNGEANTFSQEQQTKAVHKAMDKAMQMVRQLVKKNLSERVR